MQKKGAIQLSITTIIVIVIGITLLTLGIVWIRNTMKGVTEISKQSLDKARQEIMNNMPSGEKVWVHTQSIEAELGKKVDLYIGVRNMKSSPQQFSIKIVPQGNAPKDGVTGPPETDLIEPGDVKPIVLQAGTSNANSGDSFYYKIEIYDEQNNLYGTKTILVKIK